jgi:two-component system LytT family sensor kinase
MSQSSARRTAESVSRGDQWWQRAAIAVGILAAGTVIGVFEFLYRYLDDVARDHSGTFERRLIEESTGTYSGLLLGLGVVWLAVKFPFERGAWRRTWPVHLFGLLAFSALHTSAMAISRWVIFPLAGLGAYDYGSMPARFGMEFANDALTYAVLLGAVALVRFYLAMRDREMKAVELERALAQAQLQSLRLRLQPHFLFNALNTISSTMYDDPGAADEMMAHLSALLRQSLRSETAQLVPLAQELELLDGYLAIMRARFGSALRVDREIASGLERAAVPSMLLQPLVENAIHHGNATRIGAGSIAIRARREDRVLRLEVEDDGSPTTAATGGSGEQVGLSSTVERLRLLYGDAQKLDAGPAQDGGFIVRIEIPFAIASAKVVHDESAMIEELIDARVDR